MKVKIRDYQVIKEADLEFNEGLTVIVGSSNNGKSSIVRAIDSAINNKGGNSFINYDADFCLVEIEDNDQNIKWIKHKKQGKSTYTINGVELSKIGQSQIEEVAKTLNMSEVLVNNEKIRLNFWKQMEMPFLVGKTHYQLFDFISKSKQQEVVSDYLSTQEASLKEVNKGILTSNTQLDIRTKDITKFEEELKVLEKYNNIDVSRLEKLNSLTNKSSTLLNSFIKTNEAVNTLESKNKLLTERFSGIDSVKLKENFNLFHKIRTTLDKNTTFSQSISKLKSVSNKEQITLLEKNTKIIDTTLKNALQLDSKVKRIASLIQKENATQTKLEGFLEVLSNTKASSEQVSKELAKFDTCPFCKQPLNSK